MSAPVFLLAAPFCGASRLAAMLGAHPQLYVLPQLHLFMADTLGELLNIFELGQGEHADGLLRSVAELEFGAQSDDNVIRAREWLLQRPDWRCSAVLEHFATRVAPRLLVVPETDSPLRIGDLYRLHQSFPAARIVHVVRHPWSQGVTFAAYLHERLFVPIDYCDHSVRPGRIDPQIPWLRANLNIEHLRAAISQDACLLLQSESLEQDAYSALTEVCRWLSIHADKTLEIAIRQEETWAFAGYGPGTAPFGLEEDGPESAGTLPEPPSLNEPLPWLQPTQPFAVEVVAAARKYGYS